MADFRLEGDVRRQSRRWSFGSCVLDENSWSLIVGGQRASLESKPLELLHELLLHAGSVVTKDELLDRIWRDVTVVEASLPTAVHKLRAAIGDDPRNKAIIETVPGIGYRLGVPVEVSVSIASRKATTVALPPAGAGAEVFRPAPRVATRLPRLAFISAGLAIVFVALTVAFAPSQPVSATKKAPVFTQRDAADAIRELDIERIKRMLAAGWNPATPWDKEGNDALSILLNRCEWDPGQDRRQMLLMARTLIEGGAPIDRRNVWGDTAYSIAKAPRYCGPDHPVTQMLEAMCYGGPMGPKDRCLATYELTAAQRRAQGLPPKD